MAKPALDVAAIAREYGKKPVQCRACKMDPELLEVARQLRLAHGLSFPAIAKAMKGKFNISTGPDAYRMHFANHERLAV